MKKLIVGLLLLLMSNLSFSQSGYPKLILLDNKKIVVLDTNQLKSLNLLWISFNSLVEINQQLKNQILEYKELYSSCTRQKEDYEDLIKIKDLRITSKDSTIKRYSEKEKSNKRKISWLKIKQAVFGTVAVGELFYIVYSENKK